MAKSDKHGKKDAADSNPEEALETLLAQEREAQFRLREIVLALGRLNRRREQPAEGANRAFAAAALAGAGEQDDETALRDIYYALLDLFEQDHKNVTHVTPATILGEYPLGYERQPLQDFYDESVYQRFDVRISTEEVGTNGSVWALTKQIFKEGGRA
jgi:hypothetical protein